MDLVSKLIETMSRHGSVEFDVSIDGKRLVVGVDPAVHAQRYAALPEVMAGKVAQAKVVFPEAVLAAIVRSPLGLTLEELATGLDVRPRNKLKPALATLLKAKRLVKVGRRFRDATAVVRRGPKPRPPGTKPKAPGRQVSPAKLSALAKAREALAAARARRDRAAKRGR